MTQPPSENNTTNTSSTVTSSEIGHALQSLSAHLTDIKKIGNEIEVSGAKMETLMTRRDQGFQVMSQQEMVDRLLDQAGAQKDTNARYDNMTASSSPSRSLEVNAPELVPRSRLADSPTLKEGSADLREVYKYSGSLSNRSSVGSKYGGSDPRDTSSLSSHSHRQDPHTRVATTREFSGSGHSIDKDSDHERGPVPGSSIDTTRGSNTRSKTLIDGRPTQTRSART